MLRSTTQLPLQISQINSSIPSTSNKKTTAKEGDVTEIADVGSGDVDRRDHSRCAKKIDTAIHELSHKFCHEIGILRSEISEHRNSTTLSKTSDESSLQMENNDVKQRLQDL